MDKKTVIAAKYSFKRKQRKLPVNCFDRFKLRTLRINAGISQYKLAMEANVEFAAICRIEKGVQGPSFPTVVSFARYFNVPVEEFIMAGVF